MADKKKIPRIRFAIFSENWIEKKLEDSLIQYKEITTTNNQYPVLTSSRKGIFFQTDYYNGHQIASEDNTGYNIVPRGYFTYRHMSDDDVFHFNINDIADFGIVSTLYPVFTTARELDSKFLQYKLNYGKEFPRYAVLQKQGGSRTYMYFNKLKNLDLLIPSTLGEQVSISDFFASVDSYISQHQSKLEKLQTLKSSMLEKMFPKDGADMPEIRFKGFEKPWQTILLRDITSEITRTDKTSEAPIMMITAANGFMDQSNRYSFNNAGQSLAKYIVLMKGELAYNHGASKLRPYGSCFALEVDEARIPYVYHCFSISDHNPYFLSRVLNGKETEKQLRKLVTSGARMDGLLNISYEEYTTVSIQLPEREEQDRIAEYFKNIENLIVLCQQEIGKLQALKKGVLEKMFV